MGDSSAEFWEMILEERLVLAARISASRSSMLTGMALSVRTCDGGMCVKSAISSLVKRRLGVAAGR